MLAWQTAEYDIGGTNMQEQSTLSLKVNASYAPLVSQSHYTSPSAALPSTTEAQSSPKHLQEGLASSVKHKVTLLLQLY